MAKFFKTFAKGIFYVVTLPLLVIFLAVYFVISLVSFIFLSIQGIILFFKGENLVGELDEDRIAKERLNALGGANNGNNNIPPIAPTASEPITNNPTPSIPVAPMPMPIIKNEPSKEQEISLILNNDFSNIEREEDIFEPLPEPEPEPEPEKDDSKYENINITHDHSYDREEYIIDEPIKVKEEGGVDLSDYEKEDN